MDLPDSMEAGLKEIIDSFSKPQLDRFKAIFASVFTRVKRNGGEDEEAQGIALGIALSAARNFTPAPLNASLEEDTHTFTIMSPQQLGRNREGAITGQEYSFDFLVANLDIAKQIAVGSTVNLDHDHDVPVGVITDVLLASEVEGADPDIPLVYVASYFKDTPEDVKALDSVSAEWAHFDINGKQEAFPNTFAVTATPLNGKVQGLKKIASIEDKPYKGSKGVEGIRDTMPDEQAPAEIAGVSIEDFEALKASLSEMEAKANKATEELDTFKASVAGLAGKEEPNEVTAKDLEATLASLGDRVAKAEAITAEVQAAALDKEAEDFTASLVADGKISTDATKTWEASFKANKDMAVELAASLPSKHVGVNESKAITHLPEEGIDVVKAALEAQRNKLMPKEGN